MLLIWNNFLSSWYLDTCVRCKMRRELILTWQSAVALDSGNIQTSQLMLEMLDFAGKCGVREIYFILWVWLNVPHREDTELSTCGWSILSLTKIILLPQNDCRAALLAPLSSLQSLVLWKKTFLKWIVFIGICLFSLEIVARSENFSESHKIFELR